MQSYNLVQVYQQNERQKLLVQAASNDSSQMTNTLLLLELARRVHMTFA